MRLSFSWNDLGGLWPWDSTVRSGTVVEMVPSKVPDSLWWWELLPEGPWHCRATPVFSWFELLVANDLLILTTYLPCYHLFMHWRLNTYFDTCLFIMYVLVCKMRYIPVSVCTLGPQMNRKASLEPLHTVEFNAGLLRLADPNRSLWIQRAVIK